MRKYTKYRSVSSGKKSYKTTYAMHLPLFELVRLREANRALILESILRSPRDALEVDPTRWY